MSNKSYLELLNCSTPNEIYQKAREFSSDRSVDEHLIRSTILDIHANVESMLKKVLYQHMLCILFQDNDRKENKKREKSLSDAITRMNFTDVYRLLKPCLDAFPAPEFADIEPINLLRNKVTHSWSGEQVTYKGRNPYKDPDSLAELFVNGWAVREQLSHFYQVMIDDPRGIAQHYAKFYSEHHKSANHE
jgi:hypothetical protein